MNNTYSKSSTNTETFFLDHNTIFGEGHICKIFQLTAPAQSGDITHSHDYSQIWYVTSGSCEHFVEGVRHEMFVGDAFLLPPNVEHCTILNKESNIICCEFYIEDLFGNNATASDKLLKITQNVSFSLLFEQELCNGQPKFTFSPKAQFRVNNLLNSMLEEYTQAEEFYEDYLRLQILELLLIFAREYIQSPSHDASKKTYDKYRTTVESSIKYINEHYNEPLTLNGICKMSMLSKTYFCYIFKMLTHQTFLEYLTDQRITRAMELLRQTNMSVIDIGLTVGFQDSTHFSRTFKRLKGISPREYRNAANS